MVVESNEIVLLRADPISQFVGLGYILRPEFRLSEGAILPAQVRVSHGKLRIHLNGALQQRNGFRYLRPALLRLHYSAVGPPGFERRSGYLGRQTRLLFQAGERSASPGLESVGDFV